MYNTVGPLPSINAQINTRNLLIAVDIRTRPGQQQTLQQSTYTKLYLLFQRNLPVIPNSAVTTFLKVNFPYTQSLQYTRDATTGQKL